MIENDSNAYITDMLLQPECLRRLRMEDVVDAVEPIGNTIGAYKRVILTGMGSSHAALRPLWLCLLENGTPVWLVDAAECLGHCMQLIDETTLVIVASQSGRSAEIVALADAVQSRDGKLLAITNDVSSHLARSADAVIDICVGVEHAVSTKTYLNTLGVGVVLGRIFLDRKLDDALQRTADALEHYLENWRQRTERLKETVGLPTRTYFLARGPSLAAAEYGALIAKEAARWPIEAQSVPQFRHGPLELADERLTVVILAGRDKIAHAYNRALHDDLTGFGARSFWLDVAPVDGPLTIPVVEPDTSWIVEAVPLQLLSVAIAEQSGIIPGSFRHLQKVTTVL
ncbi:SIS domain-containing protein [Devosia algicola]|uniref:Glutamine--fructose-6-phosphate aminotransferase [isomerizing] n=1 Tax=Devosia algicola TaxID=3026418 RepID=A0ABY7YNB3_9HYPH|nr:SIS domain-containing protein [Devosia algicola]WDR02400.1 SIS domain-containing protein [Devosia algicola]